MSAVLRPRCVCGRPSGLARHANPGGEHTPSFQTVFRVTLVVIVLAGAFLGHWIEWALTWLAITFIVAGLYVAGSLGIIQ